MHIGKDGCFHARAFQDTFSEQDRLFFLSWERPQLGCLVFLSIVFCGWDSSAAKIIQSRIRVFMLGSALVSPFFMLMCECVQASALSWGEKKKRQRDSSEGEKSRNQCNMYKQLKRGSGGAQSARAKNAVTSQHACACKISIIRGLTSCQYFSLSRRNIMRNE